MRIERNFLSLMKDIYEKPIANTILNSESLNVSPKVRTQARMPLSPLLFNIVLEALASGNRQEREKVLIYETKE